MDMVEKVARALANYGWDTRSGKLAEHNSAEFVEANWRAYEDQARAAIEAMLEPTPEMISAVWPDGASGHDVADLPTNVWDAMITAALAEQKE